MSFLLDTNILSAHLRLPRGLMHRFIQHSGRLYTSSVALAELFVWAYKKSNPAQFVKQIDELLDEDVTLLNFDRGSANEFGRVRIDLRRQGIEVPTTDLMIGSVALVYDLTLVTHNVSDYRRIPGLRIEDWLSP